MALYPGFGGMSSFEQVKIRYNPAGRGIRADSSCITMGIPYNLTLCPGRRRTQEDCGMKLIFAEAGDVADAAGPLQLGANGLKRLEDAEGLPGLSFPRRTDLQHLR